MRAVVTDHVISHRLTMREAGLRVQPLQWHPSFEPSEMRTGMQLSNDYLITVFCKIWIIAYSIMYTHFCLHRQPG